MNARKKGPEWDDCIMTPDRPLKPCPFCNYAPRLMRLGNTGSTHGWVECSKCGCALPFKSTFEAAVDAWNIRPEF